MRMRKLVLCAWKLTGAQPKSSQSAINQPAISILFTFIASKNYENPNPMHKQGIAPILGSVPLRRHRIPWGRGMGKRTSAPNRGQFTPISGAEAQSTPPQYPRYMDNSENVQLQSRRLAPILVNVPLMRHRIPGVGVWERGLGLRANLRRFTPLRLRKT